MPSTFRKEAERVYVFARFKHFSRPSQVILPTSAQRRPSFHPSVIDKSITMDDNTTLSGSVGGPFPGPNGGFAPHDSFASSNDDSSSYESSTGSLVEEDANENHAAIAPSETKAVKISKRMVLLAIFVAAIGVATAAYVVTAEDEKESFHQEVSFRRLREISVLCLTVFRLV